MKHIQSHLKHGRTRYPIRPLEVEKGMVVFFRYTTLKDENRQYVGCVLNPDYYKKMHILAMNEVKLFDFRNFAKNFGLRYIPQFQKSKAVDLPKINMAMSSKRIYEGLVKKELEKTLNQSYRTLIIQNISGLQILDYDFGPDLNRTLSIN